MRKTLIILGIVIVVLAAVIAVYFASGATPQKVSVAQANCQSLAETFAYKYKLDNGGPSMDWDPVEAHFNSKLSACLAYLGNTMTINSSSKLRMDKVIDLTNNQAILVSNTRSVCVESDCQEYPEDSDVPGKLSYGFKYFLEEKARLMSD